MHFSAERRPWNVKVWGEVGCRMIRYGSCGAIARACTIAFAAYSLPVHTKSVLQTLCTVSDSLLITISHCDKAKDTTLQAGRARIRDLRIDMVVSW